MPLRTKSNARGKRPNRFGPSSSTKHAGFTSHITPEEALRRSKLSNAEKQAEAEAARDAAEADEERRKDRYESSWWTEHPHDYRPPSPGSSHSTTPSQFFAEEAELFAQEEEDAEETKPSTGSANRFFKTDSPPEPSYKNKKQDPEKARRKAWEKHRKRAEKAREAHEEARRKRDAALCASLGGGPLPQYQKWAEDCDAFFSNPDASSEQFPTPSGFGICRKKVCVKGDKLGFCHHQLGEVLMGSGEYGVVWLKKERVRWHPDKFPGRCEVQVLAQEVFQMIQELIDGDGRGFLVSDY